MQKNRLSWMIGGPQGSGINASAEVFAKACSRAGLHVFANIEYHSNIMGKHSFYRVRVSEEPIRSHQDTADILVALDHETLAGDGDHRRWPTHYGHLVDIAPGGGVVYDSAVAFDPAASGREDLRFYPVPFLEIIAAALGEVGKGDQARRYEIMKNTVGLGASLALCDYPFDLVAQVILDGFKGKRAEVGQLNVRAAKLAFDHVREHFGSDFPYTLKPHRRPKPRLLAKGYEVHAIAKLRAGCAFQTYYPISPATDESVFLERHQRDFNLLVVQCEDEIASINMAVGAAHMGVRASTATSGPGFALMVEGIGLAAITEAPGPVLVMYQRGGPSTGLPTRQEQADLQFVLHPAHGDFPHVVVAPGDHLECFEDTFSAFNWAERFQLPVIVLSDKMLASSLATIDELKLLDGTIDRGERYEENGTHEYLRYALTRDGLSPRSRPGLRGGQFWATSDEHDPDGHITEGVEMRTTMMRKRMGKLDLVAAHIPTARKLALHGPADADLTVVGWGSTKGAILDALAVLEEGGARVNFLQIRLMRPFPAKEVSEILGRAKRIVAMEENYGGQLAQLVQEQTGVRIDERILKYDGRPFSEDEVVRSLQRVLAGERAEAVMTHVR
ncbi:MAG: 2-oxoacid:acceptor oxidoreductase subunit alpha [Chloroflexota bacterium]|nr:2-oxoacid:acceptor oxidoreductase subunit alpha [Chloroflexota bacterium]